MTLLHLWEVGPTNGAILLSCLVAGLVVAVRTVLQLRRAEEVSLTPLVTTLAAPLLFVVYGVTWQYGAGSLDAMAATPAAAKQTYLAMALSRAVMTQILGGVAVAVPALVVIAGCLLTSELGERPRMGLAGASAVLTFALTATALASGAASGVWGLAAVRSLVYLAAGIATTAALLTTHQRGPGAQVGPVAAVVLPMLVAGLDATASGWVSAEQFRLIATTAPELRQAVLLETAQQIDTLRLYSAASLVLAVALAGLGPAASAYRSRPLVGAQSRAVALSMAAAVVVVVYGANYLVPFFFEGT
jgi:hypothetical protein